MDGQTQTDRAQNEGSVCFFYDEDDLGLSDCPYCVKKWCALTNGLSNEKIYRQIDSKDGWMDRWMDGWTDR